MQRFFSSLFISIALLSCKTSTDYTALNAEERTSAIPLSVEEHVVANLSLHARRTVASFYEMNDWKMVWMDSFSIRADGDSLLSLINKAQTLGLFNDDYHQTELQLLNDSTLSHDKAVAMDVLLTDAYFSLWHHLGNGRLDRKTFSRIPIDSLILSDAMDALKQSLAAHAVKDVLMDREPKQPAFGRLKSVLEKLLAMNLKDTVINKRREQLIANLERLRWETEMPPRFISVNVPSFTLRVIEGDSTVLESRVIIGKPETPTPNIKSVVQSFIIYPYWHVPRSILKEILAAVQADTSYLRKHNYDVINSKGQVVKPSTIDFKKYSPEDFPYVLRQREGTENTMGVIKFIFPNNYGVYLHDTNARRLFSKSDRALSHGCIRVQRAVDLAKYLAQDDDTYVDAADLEQYLLVQKRMEIKIVKPIPVHLDYFTVEPRGDSVIFFEDLYKKDKALVDSLSRNVTPLTASL